MSLYLKLFATLMFFPCISYGQERDSSWQEFSLGAPPLIVTMPGVPSPMELQIQSSMFDIISAVYAYQYEDISNTVTVMLEQIAYAKHIHPDLEALADQAVSELQTRGATDFIYNTSRVELDEKKGIRQNGTLIYKGNNLAFTTTILIENSYVWKVIIFSNIDDVVSKRIAELIQDSLTFHSK